MTDEEIADSRLSVPSLAAAEAPDSAPERSGVGFWLRALARLLDTLIHFLLGIAATVLVGLTAMLIAQSRGEPSAQIAARLGAPKFVDYLGAFVGFLAMHVLCEGLHGSTLGKRVCGITVIAEDGRHARLMAALIRTLAVFVDGLFLGLIAAGSMSETSKRQRLGDKWAKTMVVRLRSLGPELRRPPGRFLWVSLLGIAADAAVLAVTVWVKVRGA